jgi:hypothetical protein
MAVLITLLPMWLRQCGLARSYSLGSLQMIGDEALRDCTATEMTTRGWRFLAVPKAGRVIDHGGCSSQSSIAQLKRARTLNRPAAFP